MFWRRFTGRSDVLAPNGVVAASEPLAAQAGVEIMQKGGNAIDAAVATAAVLDVTEPFSTGCGGDAFVLLHLPDAKKPLAFNGSGRAGSLISLDELLSRGWTEIPLRGGASVTVPGAMHLWETLVKQYGNLEFAEVLTPAIRYARNGFPVAPIISQYWAMLVSVFQNDEAKRVFTKDGRAPVMGELMKNADLAKTFERIASEGAADFYSGEIAERIVDTVQAHGGFLTIEDMKQHETEKTRPISMDYKGFEVYEHPPNGQGFAALIMLQIMEELEVSRYQSRDARRYHLMIEAKKLAYADLLEHNADPDFYDTPIEELLSDKYAKSRASLVDESNVMTPPPTGIPRHSDTIYLCTADAEGMAVSFINSLYRGFGSGLVVPGTGIKLQNRGNLFVLNPDHPNSYAPGKRPFHTIIPGALYREGIFGVFGIMGGDHQAQAHAQFVSNLVDYQMTPQEALDHPRFHHDQKSNTVAIENGILAYEQGILRRLGHRLIHETTSTFGGGQAIIRLDHAWIAGSDHRKDGQAVCY